ncbi:hypothetical protein L2K70_14745 [Nocardioides KLBMP 9356]|uniref:WD40 repeat domain-containing protein n=1 Tax=Nocardioides potassii TaxID=2911371 RepID=A0ABS9HEW8_9ACTN|nr:hypothetical protein [Nocardioides potassii]MCF6378871.1 hypothetical protein [Nocardioides potassii]
MNTPLEDQVHDALHRRADPIQHAPLSVTDVRHRARRIQRRRAAVAGVAVAAVLAIAIPVGLSATGPGQRSDVPPATRTSSPSPVPTVTSGTVTVDPDSADVVEQAPVPLLDVDGPTLVTADGTFDLPHDFSTITPYLDGWAGVGVYDEADKSGDYIELLGPDLRVDDEGSPTGGLVVRPDGGRIAWSEYDGTRWRVVVADPAGGSEPVSTTFQPSSLDEKVIPLGFVSDDTVAVRAMYDSGDPKTFVAGGDQPVEVPGLLQADAASAGVIAGSTEIGPDGTCFGVVDAVAGGDPGWTTCDHRLGPFSATGTYVVGTSTEAEYGSPDITVLDAATGEEVLTFEAALPKRTVGGFWTQMTWVGDEAIVARISIGNEDPQMMLLGLDGSVQRIGVAASGVSGLTVAVPS